DGSQAANLLKENSDIDIILMDLQLVKSSGIKATKEIRTFNSSIPIIAETAHVLPSDKKNALEAGCSEFIPKPFTIETIINVLSKYLDA
ncbi:MAG: response regulator, partial [Bacteroidota bacterium]|nr:response regulator [Bacteroidota bacterium]